MAVAETVAMAVTEIGAVAVAEAVAVAADLSGQGVFGDLEGRQGCSRDYGRV